jgi:hypothetical protein
LDEAGQPIVTNDNQHLLQIDSLTRRFETWTWFNNDYFKRGERPHEFKLDSVSGPPPYTLNVYMGSAMHTEQITDMEDGAVHDVRFPSALLAGKATVLATISADDGQPIIEPIVFIQAAGRTEAYFIEAAHEDPPHGWNEAIDAFRASGLDDVAAREEAAKVVKTKLATTSAEATHPLLSPGEYIVEASCRSVGGTLMLAPACRVFLHANETRSVALTARVPATVEGQLAPHDAEHPCKIVYLSGIVETGETNELMEMPDSDGRFTFTSVLNGTYRCVAASAARAYGPVRIVVGASRTHNECTLTPTREARPVTLKKADDGDLPIRLVEVREEDDQTLWWSFPPPASLGDKDIAFWRDFRDQRFVAPLPPGRYVVRYCLGRRQDWGWFKPGIPCEVREKRILVQDEALTVELE